MPSSVAQLSFVETPRICLEYHPRRRPPDATGPEWGCFAAAINGQGSPLGWGRTELLAMTMLAERLRERIAARTVPPGMTAVDQAA
jgi:hypothetical protein